MVRLHCPTSRQTLTEANTETDKFTKNPMEIFAGLISVQCEHLHTTENNPFLSLSVSGSVNTP